MKMTLPQLVNLVLCNVNAITNREIYETVELLVDHCQDQGTIFRIEKMVQQALKDIAYENSPTD